MKLFGLTKGMVYICPNKIEIKLSNFQNLIMKNFFIKAALFLVMPLMAASFVSCDDDDDAPAAPAFQSELIGNYTPRFINYQLPGAIEAKDYYFIIDTDWNEGVDPNTLMVGGFMPMPSVIGIMQGVISGLVQGGLVEMELTNEGKIAAKAHELDVPADADMSVIIGMLLQPAWKSETVVFPSEETQPIYNALGYYTENGKLFLTVSKAFLKAMGETMEQPMDIVGLLESVNSQFNLGFASTATYFGIPLKYTLEGNELTIMVDKSMMKPIMPLLQPIFAQIPPIMGMINVGDMVNMLFDNTSDIRLKLLLEKK